MVASVDCSESLSLFLSELLAPSFWNIVTGFGDESLAFFVRSLLKVFIARNLSNDFDSRAVREILLYPEMYSAAYGGRNRHKNDDERQRRPFASRQKCRGRCAANIQKTRIFL